MIVAELQKEFLTGNKRIAPEDFFILLAHAIGKDKVFILSHPEYKISAANESRAKNFFFRRMHNEPVAYVLGYKEFYGQDFIVTKDTLIPRPETEMLVDLTLEEIKRLKTKGIKKISIVDTGTGSGNIIISIVQALQNNNAKFKHFEFYGIDNSAPTLKIARRNALKHKMNKTIKFLQSDLLKKLLRNKTIKQGDNIIITANLPYLSQSIYNNTAKDVRNFEPKNALLSGQMGLAHYYRLLKDVKNILTLASITLFLEISPEQKSALKKYASKIFSNAQIETKKDLAGKIRVIKIHTILK